ncbi:MAG: peptidylprolyl isomerase [Candidatus Dependentiae bacterium]
MKNTKSTASYYKLGLLVSSIALLPACAPLDWFKGQMNTSKTINGADQESIADGSEVIATIAGKPGMTANKFEADYKNFVEKHPMGALFASMPGAKKQIFKGLITQQLINKWAEDQKIEQTAEYQESLKQLIQWLNTTQFEKTLNIPTLSEAELRKFYDERKELFGDVLISCGGVNALGISFANEAAAADFLNKVKAKGADFAKIAQEKGLKDQIKDFKLVSVQSTGIDPVLQARILEIEKAPSVELIKLPNNVCWVVQAKSKEAEKRRPFEEVKALVEQRAMQEEKAKAYEKAIDELEKKYNLVVNEEYFAKQDNQAQPFMQLPIQGDAQEMQEGQVDIALPEDKEVTFDQQPKAA